MNSRVMPRPRPPELTPRNVTTLNLAYCHNTINLAATTIQVATAAGTA